MNPESRALVDAPAGTFIGRKRGAVAAFMGIPFAEAPVGELRFQAPVTRGYLPEFDATSPGSTPQVVAEHDPIIPSPTITGDDILNLNVFTPSAETNAGLPVQVWIHGGGWVTGSASSPWHDGTSFARAGVVTVAISYRLGFDGYGWMADAPSNRGLLDQVEALRWVHRNISAFGGDPDRVTLAGHSSGAADVAYLLATPAARGLFRSAILHSGIVTAHGLGVPEEASRRFAAEMGVGNDREGWGTLSRHAIAANEGRFNPLPGGLRDSSSLDQILEYCRSSGQATREWPFSPCVDGETLLPIVEALSDPALDTLPILVGAVRDEHAGHACGTIRGVLEAFDRSSPLAPRARLRLQRLLEEGGESRADAVARGIIYRAGVPQLSSARGIGARRLTWQYDFTWRSSVDGLAFHCYDLPFAWHALDAEGVVARLGRSAPRDLADRMNGDWVRFMHEGTCDWPPVSASGLAAARVYGSQISHDPDSYLVEAELIGLPASAIQTSDRRED